MAKTENMEVSGRELRQQCRAPVASLLSGEWEDGMDEVLGTHPTVKELMILVMEYLEETCAAAFFAADLSTIDSIDDCQLQVVSRLRILLSFLPRECADIAVSEVLDKWNDLVFNAHDACKALGLTHAAHLSDESLDHLWRAFEPVRLQSPGWLTDFER